MDSTAQNNSNSQTANAGQNTNSDDSLLALQAQLTALQTKTNSDEEKQTEEFKQQQEANTRISDSQNQILTQDPIQQISQNNQIPDLANFQDKANKERKDQLVGAPTPERVPYKEVQTEFEPPVELEQWMEEKPDPKEMTLPKPIEDEFGDILVQASQVPKPNIILPMEEEEIKKGLHYKVVDSIRWLAEWCKKNILLYPKRVFYNQKKPKEKL